MYVIWNLWHNGLLTPVSKREDNWYTHCHSLPLLYLHALFVENFSTQSDFLHQEWSDNVWTTSFNQASHWQGCLYVQNSKEAQLAEGWITSSSSLCFPLVQQSPLFGMCWTAAFLPCTEQELWVFTLQHLSPGWTLCWPRHCTLGYTNRSGHNLVLSHYVLLYMPNSPFIYTSVTLLALMTYISATEKRMRSLYLPSYYGDGCIRNTERQWYRNT